MIEIEKKNNRKKIIERGTYFLIFFQHSNNTTRVQQFSLFSIVHKRMSCVYAHAAMIYAQDVDKAFFPEYRKQTCILTLGDISRKGIIIYHI